MFVDFQTSPMKMRCRCTFVWHYSAYQCHTKVSWTLGTFENQPHVDDLIRQSNLHSLPRCSPDPAILYCTSVVCGILQLRWHLYRGDPHSTSGTVLKRDTESGYLVQRPFPLHSRPEVARGIINVKPKFDGHIRAATVHRVNFFRLDVYYATRNSGARVIRLKWYRGHLYRGDPHSTSVVCYQNDPKP